MVDQDRPQPAPAGAPGALAVSPVAGAPLPRKRRFVAPTLTAQGAVARLTLVVARLTLVVGSGMITGSTSMPTPPA